MPSHVQWATAGYVHARLTTLPLTLSYLRIQRVWGGGSSSLTCLVLVADFLVRWVDGTCLSYQLSSGTLSLRMASPKAGAVEPSVLEWSLKGRSHGWSSVCGNSRANTYLRLAQQAMLRCVEIQGYQTVSSVWRWV